MVTTARPEATVERVRRTSAVAGDVQDVLQGAADAVRRAVPHAASAWLATDPATTLFTHGHIEAFDGEVCSPWFHNELTVDDVHKFVTLPSGRAATGSQVDDRIGRSPRYRDLMRPSGYGDELRITCGDATGTWAAVELQREVGAADFDPTEMALVEAVAPLVAAGVRRVLVAEAALREAPDGPGVVQVHPDGSVTALTEAGARWFDLLLPPSGAHARTALLGVAQLGKGVAEGQIATSEARLRTRTVDGRWLTLHAQPMLHQDGGVMVVLEPSTSAEIASVIARGHGLTDRELEIVLAIARGGSTREMASDFFLSPHTIRDHVKSAMAKVGVTSRGELVAVLFERHYAGAFFEGVSHVS